jgi:membrane protein DedA with SNARE-associated domain/rhodanese-related sulfurtransferase
MSQGMQGAAILGVCLARLRERGVGSEHRAEDRRPLSQQVLLALQHFGLSIVIINVFVDQLGLPVPAVPTLIVAGALAATGQLSLSAVFLGASLACLIADSCWYLLGKLYGMRVLRMLCRISLEPDSCVSNTQSRFERWGVNSLIIAKFVPGLAIIAPPLAGAMRISWTRFIFLSTLSAALWVGTALIAGILFRTQVELLLIELDRIGSLAGFVAIVALACYVGYKWWERKRFFKMLRMARISVSDLHRLIESGAKPMIVDVRSRTARGLDPRFIPGALHVPLDDMARHLAELPRDREIILYCSCPSEASAARVARMLVHHGFKRVRPLFGGLDAWLAAGYAAEFTPPPQPLSSRIISG